MIGQLGFTYSVTKAAIIAMPFFHINQACAASFAISALLPAFISNLLSVVASTKDYLEDRSGIFSHNNPQKISLIFTAIMAIFGIVDILSTLLGNFVGTAELLNDFFGLNLYSWKTCLLSGIVAISSAYQYYPFTTRLALKNTANVNFNSGEQQPLSTHNTEPSPSKSSILLKCCGFFKWPKQALNNNHEHQPLLSNTNPLLYERPASSEYTV